MPIGCCNAFKQCSDAALCIKLNDPDYEDVYKGCYYSSNLEKGLNFYTPSNERNKARAEEYKKLHTNKVTNAKKVSTGTYLVLNGRQFYIGKRGKYGSYTYPLDNLEFEGLKADFPRLKFEDVFDGFMFQDEGGTEADRAEWRPYLRSGGNEYNIMNSNIYTLRKSTAIMISNHLCQLGYDVLCECLGKGISSKDTTGISRSSKQTVQPTSLKKEVSEKKTVEFIQLSIFDYPLTL